MAEPDPLIALSDLYDALIVAAERGEAGDPHVLLVTDPATNHRVVIGTYPNAYAAALDAARRREQWLRLVGEPETVFELLPFSPVDSLSAAPTRVEERPA